MLKNQTLVIQAQPQFVNISRKSEAVSTTKGNDICYETTKVTKTTQWKEYIEEKRYKYENRINKLNDKINYLGWLLNELE